MDEPVFSVSEFLDLTNELLGQRDFSVQGEVTEAKSLPSGLFFTIKDSSGDAVMGCYMNPYAYRSSGITLEAGMAVKLGGIASVYKPKGRFSFRVVEIALAGEGSLKKAYEALKKKLTAEGLFDRKRPLPEYVSRIGLVTSRTGAVINDFQKNLAPLGLTVDHFDARVEGAQAVSSIRRALAWFDAHAAQYDVMVIVRGGGSLEDLQAFNDEYVTRAVFGSRLPTVVSIGHERDVPLAQLAADATASTPTGAAHVINATWDRLRNLPRTAQRLSYEYEAALSAVHADVNASAHRLAVHVARIAGRGMQLEHRLRQGLDRLGQRIERMQDRVASAERHLEASSPERLLRLGYSIVTDEAGAIVRSAAQLRHGQRVSARLAKGSFAAEVKELSSET